MYYSVMEVIDKRRTAPMGDHGTILNVISWILLVISMCTLVARFCMKLSIKDRSRRFGSDDVFIVLATVSLLQPCLCTLVLTTTDLQHWTNDISLLFSGKRVRSTLYRPECRPG
jgi:hypothetical protein